jgi:hypothetical protein
VKKEFDEVTEIKVRIERQSPQLKSENNVRINARVAEPVMGAVTVQSLDHAHAPMTFRGMTINEYAADRAITKRNPANACQLLSWLMRRARLAKSSVSKHQKNHVPRYHKHIEGYEPNQHQSQ